MPDAKIMDGSPQTTAATTTSTMSTPSATASPSGMSFSGHHAYIVNVAKMCREKTIFTDVRIQCQDGELSAHRLVLASCSTFLRDTFLSLPQGLPEFTLIIPNLKTAVVSKLIDFLYTGKMLVTRSNAYDLQQLVHILKIDPEIVQIETPDESQKSRLVQNKLKTKPLLQKPTHNPPNSSPKSGSMSPVIINTVVESKAMPLRAAKRKRSMDDRAEEAKKTPNVISILPTSNTTPALTASISLTHKGRSALRRRGRPRQPGSSGGGRFNTIQPIVPNLLSAPVSTANQTSGYHDLSNVNTWVCAICHQYDPVLPANVDPQDAANTEWVGCDCDRWYHQYCTKLKTVDDGFNCKMVNLKCLDADD